MNKTEAGLTHTDVLPEHKHERSVRVRGKFHGRSPVEKNKGKKEPWLRKTPKLMVSHKKRKCNWDKKQTVQVKRLKIHNYDSYSSFMKIKLEYIKDVFKCGVTAGKIVLLLGDSHGTVAEQRRGCKHFSSFSCLQKSSYIWRHQATAAHRISTFYLVISAVFPHNYDLLFLLWAFSELFFPS